ncbi:acyl-CoA carboxylase epsilon subunit [Rhodococcus sp. IEGM 1330]|uniref:acyl-CoA carboxylase epsilon subunit n=1 Tax=Rhodococcus sp. IEGM 1330 TaxID=3082225 RepID=UPI002954ED20|nr:acyl-CoA carboxylase epsilon subunit [Rhodococcus sp. IEGM 1330]MDV8020191.1 acyl-CoA carboxylase epsilon subunit [Rhodococcus sp. IEGM 1330]
MNEANHDAVIEANHVAASPSWLFRGKPSDTDIAAVVAVLTVAQSSVLAEFPVVPDLWGRPEDLHRYGLAGAPALFVNARYGQ